MYSECEDCRLSQTSEPKIGAGIGLLLSDRLSVERRRRLGVALVMIGAAATVPVVMAVTRGGKGRQALAA